MAAMQEYLPPMDWVGVLGVVGLIVWSIRLEGRVNQHGSDAGKFEERMKDEIRRVDKAIDGIETKHDALDNKLSERLRSVELLLSKIAQKLGIDG